MGRKHYLSESRDTVSSAARYVTSWIETRTSNMEKANLLILFDKYIPPCLEALRTRFKRITPIVDMCHVQMLCHLLRCLLTPTNTPADCSKELHEMFFVFGCVWAFGAAMFQDQVWPCRYAIGSVVRRIL